MNLNSFNTKEYVKWYCNVIIPSHFPKFYQIINHQNYFGRFLSCQEPFSIPFFFFTIRKYSFTPQGFSEQIVKAIYFTSLKMFRYFFSTFQFLWFLYNSVIHNMTNFHFVFNSKPLWILYKGLYDQIWVICAITSWSKFLISHVNLSYLWYHLIHSLISISI